MKEQIQKILDEIGISAKIRKAKNENALWIYPKGKTQFILDETDLSQSTDYIREYIKCICDMDFNSKTLINKK